jgi:hypothetical protein
LPFKCNLQRYTEEAHFVRLFDDTTFETLFKFRLDEVALCTLESS